MEKKTKGQWDMGTKTFGRIESKVEGNTILGFRDDALIHLIISEHPC